MHGHRLQIRTKHTIHSVRDLYMQPQSQDLSTTMSTTMSTTTRTELRHSAGSTSHRREPWWCSHTRPVRVHSNISAYICLLTSPTSRTHGHCCGCRMRCVVVLARTTIGDALPMLLSRCNTWPLLAIMRAGDAVRPRQGAAHGPMNRGARDETRARAVEHMHGYSSSTMSTSQWNAR